MTDAILIRDLAARCIIGTREWERKRKQEVVLNLRIETDLARAARSDALADAVDYKAIKDRILLAVQGSSFHLLEALASSVAALVLEDGRVRRVEVTVDKPGALTGARSAAVQVTQGRAA
jgi:FolB domain-containing protein